MKKLAWLLTFSFLLAIQPSVRGQDEEAKIKKLFQDAVQALGGDTFLNVTDMVSEGNYFEFDREGNTSGLQRFNDYTKLPDRSRFELGNRRTERDVRVFNLANNEGWILEGQKPTRAASPEELNDFKKAVKHSLETIFRYRYKDPENKLFYLGISDGNVNLEMVKLIDPENDEVTIYFDRLSKLPAKLEYPTVDKRGIHYHETQEFSQWHVIQGVNTTMRIDTALNGRQAAQQFILKIAYNTNLQDSFFIKPVPPK
jgi:hypothetical protein